MHPTPDTSVSSNQNQSRLSKEDAEELKGIVSVLWGLDSSKFSKVFVSGWSQGFEFSHDEQSALIQHSGGPCSVIATCQAYIIKNLIELQTVHQFKDLTEEKCKKILIQSLCNMLLNCKERSVFRIATLDRSNGVEKAMEASEVVREENEEMNISQQNAIDGDVTEQMDTSIVNVNEERGCELDQEEDILPDAFHERLMIQNFETIEEVEKFYSDHYSILSNRYGVLLFLYSVLFTKGLENILNEVSDTSEPLIHSSFGYGSQSLINLMLTGKAVAHVFDNFQDIGGMKLKGIASKSEIGFITLMEQLRYCTVGTHYKNPKNPIWILASETHLTVLFSNDKSLVSPETAAERARRIFNQYDSENTGFISSAVLQDILIALGLESDSGYVEIMRRKLDPDNTSIILLSDFMYEFFPEDKKSTPDTFDLFHYNGIPNSNALNKVCYSHGKAILLESHTSDMYSGSNPMLSVLQTKWPNIEINWIQDRIPSLN
ncbi:hypothetical protein PVAND_010823 [Polypedilum vanderplanki]|uniref:Ubiquitin carboxyl-terminal hydrolase MINDY n=1 Tax=Polypedilum vanderplanki TaxID=319348 RepID=A0A9J6CHF8_POLVA|nr:hypothetical protein PVAND_010823 [Polypedilum vanderplanki]